VALEKLKTMYHRRPKQELTMVLPKCGRRLNVLHSLSQLWHSH